MRGGTHALAGVLIGAALAAGRPIEVAAAAVIAGGIGALMPDLDHPQAALSRRVGLLAAPIRLFVRHRGALHGLPAVLLAFIAALSIDAALRLYGLAAAAGYASHIALDGLTVTGVPLLWPWSRRFRLLTLRTGGITERLFAVAMFGALLMLGVRLL